MRRKHRQAVAEFRAKGYEQLADYNAEVSRGIVHTAEYTTAMAVIQKRFNDEHNPNAKANAS